MRRSLYMLIIIVLAGGLHWRSIRRMFCHFSLCC